MKTDTEQIFQHGNPQDVTEPVKERQESEVISLHT